MSGFKLNKICCKQETSWTCGPACIKMFLRLNGIKKTEKQLVKLLKTNKIVGTKNSDIYNFVKKQGFSYVITNNSSIKYLKQMLKEKYFVIVCYYIKSENIHHYSVVKRITNKKIFFLDPYFGSDFSMDLGEFEKSWGVIAKYSKEKNWFIAIKK